MHYLIKTSDINFDTKQGLPAQKSDPNTNPEQKC